MQTNSETVIRTRADGSIDTAFYMARGRQERSRAALGIAPAIRGWLRRRFARPQSKARLLTAEPGRTVAPATATAHAAAGVRRAA